jgi:hypothetical protein
MFTRNIGILDRVVRVALGLVLLPVGLFLFSGLQGKILGLVIAGLGGLGLITGFTGFCPLYIPFGINTLKKEQELFARVTSTAGGLMDRCMSMIAGWSQGSVDSGPSRAEKICGPCPPSIGETHHQQG